MRRDSMKSAPARSARGARRERRLRIVSAAISRPCSSISAASARVLPPPPAQRSITVCPGCASHKRAIIWLPSSCTSTSPSFQSAVCSTGQPSVKRSEEHTSELQSLMRTSYAVFCLKNTLFLCYISSSHYYHYIPYPPCVTLPISTSI